LHVGWPKHKFEANLEPVKGVDNCWGSIRSFCNKPNTSRPNLACAQARQARIDLSLEWQQSADAFEAARPVPTPFVDIAVHIRKGDLPRKVSSKYGELVNSLYPRGEVTLFLEYKGDGRQVAEQLKNHTVREVDGNAEGSLTAWLMMRSANVLIQHDSSFSGSAALARHGIVFSQKEKPQDGRYDDNQFVCKFKSWWWSIGHGTRTCPLLSGP